MLMVVKVVCLNVAILLVEVVALLVSARVFYQLELHPQSMPFLLALAVQVILLLLLVVLLPLLDL
jgi:hypothetical protein